MKTVTIEMTEASYRAMLTELTAAGYRTAWFADDSRHTVERRVWLRHDIDFSLESAVNVAEWENDLGCGATYFVQVRSELYNVGSARAVGQLRRILEMGHQIGLHIDLDNYSDEDRAAGVIAEISALAAVAPAMRRDFVSLHRPGRGRFAVENVGLPSGIGHTYEARWVASIKYFADSGGTWREHPLSSVSFHRGQDLHVLTHPMWWIAKGTSPLTKLDSYLSQRRSTAVRALAETTVSMDVSPLAVPLSASNANEGDR